MKNWFQRVVASVTVCLMVAWPSVSFGDVYLKSLHDPIPVEVITPVDVLTTPTETPFQFRLPQAVFYRDQYLPAGATFNGKIKEVRPSKRYGRPAKFEIVFDSITLPDASQVAIPQTEKESATRVAFREDDRWTTRSLLSKQTIITAVSVGITTTVGLSLGLSGLEVYIVDEIADAAVGTATELAIDHPNDERSTKRKAIIGALRGMTVIPTVVEFVKKAPNISYEENQVTEIKFPSRFLKHMFSIVENPYSYGEMNLVR